MRRELTKRSSLSLSLLLWHMVRTFGGTIPHEMYRWRQSRKKAPCAPDMFTKRCGFSYFAKNEPIALFSTTDSLRQISRPLSGFVVCNILFFHWSLPCQFFLSSKSTASLVIITTRTWLTSLTIRSIDRWFFVFSGTLRSSAVNCTSPGQKMTCWGRSWTTVLFHYLIHSSLSFCHEL